MEAVFNTLSAVLSAVAGFFSMIGDLHTLTVELFGEFGVTFFMIGFFGLLFTFLWFLFRFLDRSRLALPTIVFALFFIIFLSGNLLMLSQETHARKAAESESAPVEQTVPEGSVVL